MNITSINILPGCHWFGSSLVNGSSGLALEFVSLGGSLLALASECYCLVEDLYRHNITTICFLTIERGPKLMWYGWQEYVFVLVLKLCLVELLLLRHVNKQR